MPTCKDDLERQLSTMVCAGDLTLKGAQHEIATDWRAGLQKVDQRQGLRGTVAAREAQMRLKPERGDGARRTIFYVSFAGPRPWCRRLTCASQGLERFHG